MNGETKVWSVLHVPDKEEEDARRLHREIERLKKERIAHTNRIMHNANSFCGNLI